MSSLGQVALEYLTHAAPYVAPPLALMFATLVFKFIATNKKTRKYAQLLMNVLQGKLESTIGPEKSKIVLELWNEIVAEAEANPSGKSKAYCESYFLRRLRNAAELSSDDEEQLKLVLEWMHGAQDVNAASAEIDNPKYKFPKLPCVCEL